jgi:two-component system OmpR family response regulator/two-component system copper resistance phosphate regulon response regulator CusR
MDILIIEDEAVLGKALEKGLSEGGHHCTWTRSGCKGLELARSQKFDAVVLDLMLPDLPGMRLLESLRGEGIQTPVLVLTALGSVENRVQGLKCGADDYLVKPFAFPELTARLDALCRRSAIRPSMTLAFGPLRIDIASRRVTRQGKEIDLSPTEFSIIELLMRYAGQVVTRKMLNEHIWGDDWTGMNNVIDVHINHLRTKIERGFDEPLIHTVRGRGYVLRGAPDH